jgi:hypothetical protein
MLKIFYVLSIVIFNSAYAETTFAIQNIKKPILNISKDKLFEIKYNDALSQLLASELSNRLLIEGINSRILSSYSEEVRVALQKKNFKRRADYLFDLKFIEYVSYSSSPTTKGLKFLIRLIDNKSGEILKEYYEDDGSITLIQRNNGTGLQLLMELKALMTFENIFLGHEADMDYLKFNLPIGPESCDLVKSASIAISGNLYLIAEENLNKASKECNSDNDRELISALMAIAYVGVGNNASAINVLEKHLINKKSEMLSMQLEKIKKFGTAQWR